MRTTLIILIASILCSASLSGRVPTGRTSLRVMTFNLRHDFSVDTPNHWSARKAWAAQLICSNHPDILGTQELTVAQLHDLQKLLPKYAAFGVARKDGKDRGEFCSLFYHKGKYTLLQNATFWLSPTPEDTGSVGWDAALPRIVTWGKFREIRSGQTFFVFNTHFDHKGEMARDSSAVLLMRKVTEIAAEAPAFITGDFNATPESNTLRLLTTNAKRGYKVINPLLLTTNMLNPVWTFDGFGSTPVQSRERIDYIFSFDPVKMIDYRHIDQRKKGLYASDHLPVVADFAW